MLLKKKLNTMDSSSPKSDLTRTHTNKSNAAPRISAETTNLISSKLKERLQKTRNIIKVKKIAFSLEKNSPSTIPQGNPEDLYQEPKDIVKHDGFIEQLGTFLQKFTHN